MEQQKKHTHGALQAPNYPDNIPQGGKWLGSEGYGVWFVLSKEKNLAENEYRIRRYTDDGRLDCDRVFRLVNGPHFNVLEEFEMGYISHCQKCTVYQDNKKIEFEFLREFEQK